MAKLSNIERFQELKKLRRLEIELHRENIHYILQNNSITESSKYEGIRNGVDAAVKLVRFYFAVFRNSKDDPTKDFNFDNLSIKNILSKVNFTNLFSSLLFKSKR